MKSSQSPLTSMHRSSLPWPILGRLVMISALASGVAWLCTRCLICGVLRGGIGLMVFGGWSHRYCGFSAGFGQISAAF